MTASEHIFIKEHSLTDYNAMKQSHAGCMVCGNKDNNPASMQLAFCRDGDNEVSTQFLVTPRYQGYTGLMHGGMTSTLLDAAMTHCLFALGIEALTAELVVRFVKPVPVGEKIKVSAALVGQRRGVYQLESFIMLGQQVLAHATAKFLKPRK